MEANSENEKANHAIWHCLDRIMIGKHFQEFMKSSFNQLLKLDNIEFLPSGSMAEGVTGLNFSDVDVMYIVGYDAVEYSNCNDTRNKLNIITNGIVTGFCILESNERILYSKGNISFTCNMFENKFILSSTNAKTQFKEFLESVALWTGPEYFNNSHLQGPSTAADIPKSLYGHPMPPEILQFDGIDHVLALKCVTWPSVAAEWLHRERQYAWPPASIVDYNRRNGCLLVPVGKKGSATEEIEWRFSFSKVELQLMHSFNDTQIKCYGLLKMLLKKILKQTAGSMLSTYNMKTTMFWESEETDPSTWIPQNLLYYVQRCFCRILRCLERDHFPNYFIKSQNLLDGKFEPTPDELVNESSVNAMRKRENLKICLTDIHENLTSRIMNIPPFLETIDPIFLEIEDKPNTKYEPSITFDIETTALEIRDFAVHLACRFAVEVRAACFVDIFDLQNKPGFDTMHNNFKFYAQLINFYKKTLGDFQGSDRGYYAKSNALQNIKDFEICSGNITDIHKDVRLASLYFILSQNVSALKILNRVVDAYSNDFYLQHRALTVFLKEIHQNKELREILYIPDFTFPMSYLQFLPQVLQTEVVCSALPRPESPRSRDLTIPMDPLLYANLLRFLCRRRLDQNIPQLEAIKGIKRFIRLQKRHIPHSLALSYNILGHCLQSVREPKQAFKAFYRALKQERKSRATLWNVAVLLNKELWKEWSTVS